MTSETNLNLLAPSDLAELVERAIELGRLDDQWDSIEMAIWARKRALAISRRPMFYVGQIVVFNRRARPKYLEGTIASVNKISDDDAHLWIEFPSIVKGDTGGRFEGQILNVSALTVDPFDNRQPGIRLVAKAWEAGGE